MAQGVDAEPRWRDIDVTDSMTARQFLALLEALGRSGALRRFVHALPLNTPAEDAWDACNDGPSLLWAARVVGIDPNIAVRILLEFCRTEPASRTISSRSRVFIDNVVAAAVGPRGTWEVWDRALDIAVSSVCSNAWGAVPAGEPGVRAALAVLVRRHVSWELMQASLFRAVELSAVPGERR